MKFNKRHLCLNSSLFLLLSYLVVFVLYYIPVAVEIPVSLIIIFNLIIKAAYLFLPIAAVLVALIIYSFMGIKRALISLIPLSLTRLLFLMPMYYLQYIARLYDTIDSLLFGFLIALAEVVLTYVIFLCIFFLMRLLAEKKSESKSMALDFTEYDFFNFNNGITFSIFILSLISFLYYFVKDAIDMVKYFIGTNNIVSRYVLSYCGYLLYDIALFFAFHFMLCILRRATANARIMKNEDVDKKLKGA